MFVERVEDVIKQAKHSLRSITLPLLAGIKCEPYDGLPGITTEYMESAITDHLTRRLDFNCESKPMAWHIWVRCLKGPYKSTGIVERVRSWFPILVSANIRVRTICQKRGYIRVGKSPEE